MKNKADIRVFIVSGWFVLLLMIVWISSMNTNAELVGPVRPEVKSKKSVPVIMTAAIAISEKKHEVKQKVVKTAKPVKKNSRNRKDVIIHVIDKYLKGGNLEGTGILFYRAFEDHNVSAVMMAGIAIFESRVEINGVWIAGMSRNTIRNNNFNGMNARKGFKRDGRFTKYDSIPQAIDDMGYWIRYYYLDGNNRYKIKCKTIDDIGAIYCPPSDPTDGTHGQNNSMWPKVVARNYDKMMSEVNALFEKGDLSED